MKIHEKVMSKSWESREKLMRKSWKCHEKVMRMSWECPEKVLRKSCESSEKLMRQSWEIHMKFIILKVIIKKVTQNSCKGLQSREKVRKSYEKVMKRSWESCQKVIRKLYGSCEKIITKLWESRAQRNMKCTVSVLGQDEGYTVQYNKGLLKREGAMSD